MPVLSKPIKGLAPKPVRCLAPFATADYLDWHNHRAQQLASSLSVMMFEDIPQTQAETQKYDPLYDGEDPNAFKRRTLKGRRKEAPKEKMRLMSRDNRDENEELVEKSGGAKVFRKITRMVTRTKHIKLLDYQLRLIEMSSPCNSWYLRSFIQQTRGSHL
jgi:hypothetical protein